MIVVGHIQYYLEYAQQPWIFRSGAHDGFHEGIGDVLVLSMTPQYLQRIGLLPQQPENERSALNYLMRTALDRLAFLPFGLLMDQWRWSVFDGSTPPTQYNKKWWELRESVQGIAAPLPRKSEDFDPGAKYHIAANVPYLRYFLAHILQVF